MSPPCAFSRTKRNSSGMPSRHRRIPFKFLRIVTKGGVDTYLQVITAQTIELANERNDIDILRRRLDASVLLIKALGGGWNASNLPTFGASTVRDY